MLTKEKQIIVCIEIQEGLSGSQSPDRESIPEEHTAWDSLFYQHLLLLHLP